MIPQQRKRAKALIRKACCNYDDGNCIALDDGEECVCPQTISYSVLCKWFRKAVLPQDKALEAEIFHDDSIKLCAECGAGFVSHSNRAKYCPNCVATVHRRQKTPAIENGGRMRTNRVEKILIYQGFQSTEQAGAVYLPFKVQKQTSNRPQGRMR